MDKHPAKRRDMDESLALSLFVGADHLLLHRSFHSLARFGRMLQGDSCRLLDSRAIDCRWS